MSKLSAGTTDVDSGSDTERLLETDVDPELERQLASAKDNEPVEAVLVLRQRSADWPHPYDPEALLRRVCRNEPAGAVERTMLPRLGVLIVRACLRHPPADRPASNRLERSIPVAHGCLPRCLCSAVPPGMPRARSDGSGVD